MRALAAGTRAAAVAALVLASLVTATGPSAGTQAGDEWPGLVPVTGATDGADAVPLAPGRYVDTMPEADEVRFYAVERELPGSILRWGITTLDDVSPSAGLVTQLVLQDDSDRGFATCGNVVRPRAARATTMPLASFGGAVFDTPRCRDSDDLLLVVTGTDAGGRSVAPGTSYQLDVWEEPASTVPEILQNQPEGLGRLVATPDDEVTEQVEPGGTRVGATPLEDGTVHVDLEPGRIGWFAVELGLDQLLAVEATTVDAQRRAQGAGLEVRVLAPLGGLAGWSPDVSVTGGEGVFDPAFGPLGLVGVGTTRVQAQTVAVGPDAYDGPLAGPSTLTDTNTGLLATPGWYAVALWVDDLSRGEAGPLPVTLSTRVLPGISSRGAPFEYDWEVEPELPFAPVSGVGPTAYDGAAAVAERQRQLEELQAVPEPEDEGIGPVVWLLLGLTVLLVGAGSYVLARARRQRADRDAGPTASPTAPTRGAG